MNALTKIQDHPILSFVGFAVGITTGMIAFWSYVFPEKYPLIELVHDFDSEKNISLAKELELAKRLFAFKDGASAAKPFAFKFEFGDVRKHLQKENGAWSYNFGGRIINFKFDVGCHPNATISYSISTESCDTFLILLDQPDPRHPDSTAKFNKNEFSKINRALGEAIKVLRAYKFDPKNLTSFSINSSEFNLVVTGFGRIEYETGGGGNARAKIVPLTFNPDKFTRTIGN